MDFSKCLINFEECEEGKRLYEHFSELLAIPNVKEYSDEEIKLSICISDFDSPFIKKITDAEMRLNAIFDYLNISDQKLFADMLAWRCQKITDFVSFYLQMQADQDWRRYMNLEKLCGQLQDDLGTPINKDDIDADVKRKLSIEKEIDNIIEKLKKYESRLFPDRIMKRAIIINEMKKIVSYPERFAMERQVI